MQTARMVHLPDFVVASRRMPNRADIGSVAHVPMVRVHVFRVEEGLGNAVLLELPDDTCAIIDWGTEKEYPLKAALAIAKRGRVRTIAATHDHSDHTAGLVKLFETFVDEGVKIEQFVYPTSQLRDLDKLSAARIRARELGIPIHPVHIRTNPKMALEPDPLDWEDDLWDLMVLAPLDIETASVEVKSFEREKPAGNPTSLVVLFAFESDRSWGIRGEGRVLLTGDATTRVLETAVEVAAQSGLVLDNQLMIVPHHGGVGVLPGWLEKSIYGIAVISARTNSPHHPQLETLRKLAGRTCKNDEKKLFCTSYAQVCREQFEKSAETKDQHLVKEGSCFGHMVIRVPLRGPATYEASSHDGEQRRRFGWCGNIGSAQS